MNDESGFNAQNRFMLPYLLKIKGVYPISALTSVSKVTGSSSDRVQCTIYQTQKSLTPPQHRIHKSFFFGEASRRDEVFRFPALGLEDFWYNHGYDAQQDRSGLNAPIRRPLLLKFSVTLSTFIRQNQNLNYVKCRASEDDILRLPLKNITMSKNHCPLEVTENTVILNKLRSAPDVHI